MTIAWANLLPSDLDPALRALADRRRTATTWWLSRAATAWPDRWRAAWSGAERPMLALWSSGGARTAVLLRRGGLRETIAAPDDCSDAGLAAWRTRHGGDAEARLGLALDRSLFFERRFNLPDTALPHLPALLEQEILCRTPFDPDEIWHAAEIEPAGTGLRTIRHWILRRDHALGPLAELGLDASQLDAVLLREDDGRLRPVIPLRKGPQPSRIRNCIIGRLALLALLATLVSLVAFDLWEGARAARVADALAIAQGPIGLPHSGNPVETLMALKTAPGLGAVWAELSRILPDDTYLSEMRLENGSVSIRGFSNNATALVRTVSASPLFTTAALTAGIAPNAREGRDGFSLAFDLRGVTPKKRLAAPVAGTGFP